MPGSILLVEDDPDFAESVAAVLRTAGYRVEIARKLGEALPMLARGGYDAVLSDINLPDNSAPDIVEKLGTGASRPPVVLMTGANSLDRAVQATFHGAFDYLCKPMERGQLLEVMGKAVASHLSSPEAAVLPEEADAGGEGSIVGHSPEMVRLFKEIGRVARQRTPVLVLGETGTGKELVAQAIHRYSGLGEKPFVTVNCAAIPETLVESELFGHEKGTFTGAQARRTGRFQEADGGVLFLDEIGELPLPTQAKLLRVLQNREVQPLGGPVAKVDVLVVAATHRNLEDDVRAGRFREDLYFRLNLAILTLPPLRERRDDIPSLVGHFLRRQNGNAVPGRPALQIGVAALDFLKAEPWPGNIRELENTLRRAAMLTTGGVIGLDQVQAALRRDGSLRSHGGRKGDLFDEWIAGVVEVLGPGAPPLLHDVERRTIDAVLRHTGGHKAQAARLLGINRKTLREKIELYALTPPDSADSMGTAEED